MAEFVRFTGPLAKQLEAIYAAAISIEIARDKISAAVRAYETRALKIGLSAADFAAILEEQVLDGACSEENDILSRIQNRVCREAAEDLHYQHHPIDLNYPAADRILWGRRTPP